MVWELLGTKQITGGQVNITPKRHESKKDLISFVPHTPPASQAAAPRILRPAATRRKQPKRHWETSLKLVLNWF